MTEESFERLASMVFPKPELCGRLMAVQLADLQVAFFPLSMESPKYARHRFSFTFGMVFRADDDAGPFRPVLKKMARTFADLEEKMGFLTAGGVTEALLARIMDDLVTRGEVMVRLDHYSTAPLALKLFPKLLEPPQVSDYQVPVLIRNLRPLMNRDWDLTVQRLEPFIDGKRFVKRLAVDAGMELPLVRRCLRQLLYYRAITMVDMFQYSNTYKPTRVLARLAESEAMQFECLRAVLVVPPPPPPAPPGGQSNGATGATFTPSRSVLAHFAAATAQYREYWAGVFSRVFQLYAKIHPFAPFGAFCIEYNFEGLGVDEERFITFGLRSGVLKRVRSIPVFVPHLSSPPGSVSGAAKSGVADRSRAGGPPPENPASAWWGPSLESDKSVRDREGVGSQVPAPQHSRASAAPTSTPAAESSPAQQAHLPQASGVPPPPSSHARDTQVLAVRRLINGDRCFDVICGTTAMSSAELAVICSTMPDVVVVRR